MSTFASDLNNSPAMCGGVPWPAEAKVNTPGFALASAMTSRAVFAGSEGCATTSVGPDSSSDTGTKSRAVS